MTDPRIITAARVDEDAQYEAGLRPRLLDEYIGQDRVRENLQVAIAAAKQRREPLDHVLLHGPPGLGKTTLAYVIGNEMGVQVRATSGPAIEKPGDLVGIVTNLAAGDVLFIDEIHRMSPVVEEILYPALEDYEVDIAHAALKLLEVDEHGFDDTDRKLLRTIIDKFGGGPVGLNTIAAAISEEKDAIEDIYEPFLIQIGFLDRTPRGRVATPRAYGYFGLVAPAELRRDSRLW